MAPPLRKFAKYIGIDTDAHREPPAKLPADAYAETVAGTEEFLREILPTGDGIKHYVLSLFPFLTWIHHYNLVWLMGDLIAGITVGFVVVPQGMAYALLAELPVEYGLYTSFVGFLLYWAFATSKDITIGVSLVLVGELCLFSCLKCYPGCSLQASPDSRRHVHHCR